MGTNFDVNKGMEHKKSRPILIGVVIIFVLFIGFLTFNGKHNKLPGGFETNIPKTDSVRKDTTTVNNNQKTEINMKDHNGDIIVNNK